MLDRLPEQIEPLGLADVGRSFRGELPVSALTRLAGMLRDTQGELAVELRLGVDERRVRVLGGRIAGELRLTCQRCLDELRFPLDLEFRLGIVRDESEGDRLPEGYEPLLAGGDPMPLADIVEDEVILALPVIAMHGGENGCEMKYRNTEAPVERANPFAVLEKLKSNA